jgi:hypothetical protein
MDAYNYMKSVVLWSEKWDNRKQAIIWVRRKEEIYRNGVYWYMMGCKALCFLFSELGIGITVTVKKHFGKRHKKLLLNGNRNKSVIIQTESFNIQCKIFYIFEKTENKIAQVSYYHWTWGTILRCQLDDHYLTT